ncbi:hypothetical protein CXU12_05220 [Akkermansia muciniphila]|nr:hypothetical protein CXU12_05220 [Akkermansia muciniphila]
MAFFPFRTALRAQSALDIFRRPYTLWDKDEECPDIDLLPRAAVARSRDGGGTRPRGPGCGHDSG